MAKSEQALIERLMETLAENQRLLSKFIAKAREEMPTHLCRACETLHTQAMVAEGQGACAKGCDEWLVPVTPKFAFKPAKPDGPRVADDESEDERKRYGLHEDEEAKEDERRERGVAAKRRRGGRIDGVRIADDLKPKHGGRLDGRKLT